MTQQTKTYQNDIRSLITSDAVKKAYAAALPKHLTPNRFARIALTALNKTPRLLQCTKGSILSCLMDCSQLGIEPDGRKAHLIPYGNVCTLIIDYKGLVDLARRSGQIADIHADVVYANDKFEYSYGSQGRLVHQPALSNRGEPIAAYSFVRLKDGSSSYEVMNIEQIEAIHQRSKAKDNGPWITDWAEMAKKSVFRRHSKWLPVSSELFQQAIETDFDVATDVTTKPEIEMPVALSEQEQPTRKEKKEKPQQSQQLDVKMINQAQVKVLHTIGAKLKNSMADVNQYIGDKFGLNSIDELTFDQAQKTIDDLIKKIPR